MDEQEIRKVYPGAAELILIHEENLPQIAWAMMVEKYNSDPREAVKMLIVCADNAIAQEPEGAMIKYRHQFDHPDFLKYVAGKLGVM